MNNLKELIKNHYKYILLFFFGYILLITDRELETLLTKTLRLLDNFDFYLTYAIFSLLFYLTVLTISKRLKKILLFKNTFYRYFSVSSLGAFAGFLTNILQAYLTVMFQRIF